MNRQEHIRQVLAVARSHQRIVDALCDMAPVLIDTKYTDSLREAASVATSHQIISNQMADDQARCEQFAVAFWHRVFHRNLREHGER